MRHKKFILALTPAFSSEKVLNISRFKMMSPTATPRRRITVVRSSL